VLALCNDSFLQEHSKVNMNAMGDDHVSFSASHLAVSPCQRYLLVSTDGSRIIMFRLKGTFLPDSFGSFAKRQMAKFAKCMNFELPADWTQTRNFYGLSVEEKFHQPCAAWHKSSFYIFAAAAAGHVYVFHVGTTKVWGPKSVLLLCLVAAYRLTPLLAVGGSSTQGSSEERESAGL